MQEPAASEVIYRGAVVTLRVETVPEPIGGTRRFEIVEHAEAVAVVALRGDHRAPGGEPEVALVRQVRPAVRRELWEIPAGSLEPEERGTPERAASRELAEETGYRASVWRPLAHVLPSPGFTTERIAIFLATGVRPAQGMTAGAAAPADPSEIAAVRWVPLGEALRMCREGEIEDGKTIVGLYLARDALAAGDAVRSGPTAPPASEGAAPDHPGMPVAPGGDAEGEGGAVGQERGEMMPRDVLNMPMGRDAAFRADGSGERGPRLDGGLKLENMLLEEFNYASVTAYQALEDRARMFNLYLLLIGVVGSALGAIFQFAKPDDPVGLHDVELLVLTLLTVGGLLGIMFFLKLIRLRAAYRDSLIAMNAVKEYYIRAFKDAVPDVASAFRWRLKTIPTGERWGSVTFVVCYTVAFLASLCFAGAALVAGQLWRDTHSEPTPLGAYFPVALAAVMFVLVLLLHVLYYRRKLNKRAEREILAAIEGEVARGEAPVGAK